MAVVAPQGRLFAQLRATPRRRGHKKNIVPTEWANGSPSIRAVEGGGILRNLL